MGPIQALRSCLSKFFRWRGRASRSEFWWFFAIYYGGIFAYIAYALITSAKITERDVGAVAIYMMVLLPPFIAVLARRLHDKGLTAWLLLLGVVPFGQLALLILALLRGDVGPNSYGEDPLGRNEPEGLTYGSSRVPLVRDKD